MNTMQFFLFRPFEIGLQTKKFNPYGIRWQKVDDTQE